MLGILYSPRFVVVTLPLSSLNSSINAAPIAFIAPPSIWPWWATGLMIVPTSWAVTKRWSFTRPVSGSTSTSATWATKEVEDPLRGDRGAAQGIFHLFRRPGGVGGGS